MLINYPSGKRVLVNQFIIKFNFLTHILLVNCKQKHLEYFKGSVWLIYSILGSMMFNYSTMQFYEYLVEKLSHKLYLLTFLGYISGRIMMVHLMAYLYHVDTRISESNNRNISRNSNFETMYI